MPVRPLKTANAGRGKTPSGTGFKPSSRSSKIDGRSGLLQRPAVNPGWSTSGTEIPSPAFRSMHSPRTQVCRRARLHQNWMDHVFQQFVAARAWRRSDIALAVTKATVTFAYRVSSHSRHFNTSKSLSQESHFMVSKGIGLRIALSSLSTQQLGQ
jgi:hypothetical protein